MNWMFNRIINRSEQDTGYSADYLREILAASKIGFFKLMLAMNALTHRKHADVQLHQIAQLGANWQEGCGPCLEISKAYALAADVPKETVEALLNGTAITKRPIKSAFLLGRHVAGGPPLDRQDELALERAIGRHGIAELTVSAAIVRIFPALKRGLGYAEMCALPIRTETDEERPKIAS